MAVKDGMKMGPPKGSGTEHLGVDEAGLARAALLLQGGGLVAFPTETVYGLGADATNSEAVARVFDAKGRPSFNPLIVHVSDLAIAQVYGRFSAQALALAEAFWPGPLTLVVPALAASPISALASAGLDSIALRVTSNPIAQNLLRLAACPVAAPSANRSGRISPTTAAHVLADLDGRIAGIVDGGRAAVGVESTIIACLDGPAPFLLRPGGVSSNDIAELLGAPPARMMQAETSAPRAPGLLQSHYAPRARVRLNAHGVTDGEAWLGFAGRTPDAGSPVSMRDLSASGDLIAAAANLFAFLHELDASGAHCIAVAPIPSDGLGEAINDRLLRAAAPR